MSVIPLTLTISLCLVFTFLVFFIREQGQRHLHDAESESLLPLADETPRLATAAPAEPEHARVHGAADHVCRNGGSCDSCRRHALLRSLKTGAAAPAPSAHAPSA